MNRSPLYRFLVASGLLLPACQRAHAPAPVAVDAESSCPDRDGPLFPFPVEITEERFSSECGQKLFDKPRVAWGYMTASGCVAIPPQFEVAEPFVDGRAVVGVGEAHETSNQWGILVSYGAIDHAGAFAVEPEYLALSSFSGGVATGILSEVPPGEMFPSNIGYFVSEDGERLGDAGCGIQLNVNLNDCDEIAEGLRFTRPKRPLSEWEALLTPDRYASLEASVAPLLSFVGEDGSVSSNQTPGVYIDAQGEQVFEGWFDEGCDFSEGLACARPLGGDRTGFIDATGQFVIEPRFESAASFHNGLARVNLDGKRAFIRPDGEVAFETEEYVDWVAGESYIAFSRSVDGETRWGFLDVEGQVAIEPTHLKVGEVSEGLVAVQTDTYLRIPRWTFIDMNGEVAPGFEDAAFVSYGAPRFVDGLAKVEVVKIGETGTHYEWIDGVMTERPGEQLHLDGYVNARGEWVLEPTLTWPDWSGMLYTGAGFCEDG